jgi:hypothetical protein
MENGSKIEKQTVRTIEYDREKKTATENVMPRVSLDILLFESQI